MIQSVLLRSNMTGPAGSSTYSPMGGHDVTVERVGTAVGTSVGLELPGLANSVGSAVGVRLGANIGYLKLTDRPRVNPF